MKNNRNYIITAMFAALVCVATYVIRIPTVNGGYVNLGDCFILISSWILPAPFAFFAGGVGSAFADLFAGYTQYVIPTLIIKGTMALVSSLIFKKMTKSSDNKNNIPALIVAALTAEIIMISGYCINAAVFMGLGKGALLNIPGDSVQGAVGMISGIILMKALDKAGLSDIGKK